VVSGLLESEYGFPKKETSAEKSGGRCLSYHLYKIDGHNKFSLVD